MNTSKFSLIFLRRSPVVFLLDTISFLCIPEILTISSSINILPSTVGARWLSSFSSSWMDSCRTKWRGFACIASSLRLLFIRLFFLKTMGKKLFKQFIWVFLLNWSKPIVCHTQLSTRKFNLYDKKQ